MHPEEFTDTDPRAMEVWPELLGQMPAGEKLAVILNGAQFVLQFVRNGRPKRMHR